jgi:hypothetical protein
MIEEAGEKVGRMLSAEASQDWTVEGCADQTEDDDTLNGLANKYPWWVAKTSWGEKDMTQL